MRLALPLILAALLSACTTVVTEQQFLPNPKSPLVSDAIQRQNLALPIGDGQQLRGWRLTPPAPRATLVYFYGNGDQLWSSARHLHLLVERLQVEIVAYDYRGSGASDGSKRFQTLRDDALRIADSVGANNGRPLLVMGYSLGSIPAIHLAAQRPVAGLAVISGISSFDDVLPGITAMAVPWYARPFVRLEFEPVFRTRPQPKEQLASVGAPTFILHGDADPQIPVVSGDELAKASPAAWKRFARLPGQGHNPRLFEGDALDGLKAWVDAALAAR